MFCSANHAMLGISIMDAVTESFNALQNWVAGVNGMPTGCMLSDNQFATDLSFNLNSYLSNLQNSLSSEMTAYEIYSDKYYNLFDSNVVNDICQNSVNSCYEPSIERLWYADCVTKVSSDIIVASALLNNEVIKFSGQCKKRHVSKC